MGTLHVSDGDREVWAIEDEVRRLPAIGAFGCTTALVAGGLVVAMPLLGPFTLVGLLIMAFASTDPTRLGRSATLRRYRRVVLDPAGLHVDWLDELPAPPSDDRLLAPLGCRAQHVRWDEVTAIERVGLQTLRITTRSGATRELSPVPAAVTRALHDRLREVWDRVRRGEPDADAAARSRAQVEQLLAGRSGET
ncbi:MAG: hypothetical protein AAF211_03720 [Myxococcota bacterium]